MDREATISAPVVLGSTAFSRSNGFQCIDLFWLTKPYILSIAPTTTVDFLKKNFNFKNSNSCRVLQ